MRRHKREELTVECIGCPKSLEPMEIVIIFLIFIYRLNLKVKRLKIALTLVERVETLHFGDS
jgi:hypothetical protein